MKARLMMRSGSCCWSDRGGKRIGEPDEIEAQLAQASARLLVVGLQIGARFAHAAEIKPACAGERRRLDELQNGRAALLDRADRLNAAQADHRRIHEGRRMQAIDGDVSSRELRGEIE